MHSRRKHIFGRITLVILILYWITWATLTHIPHFRAPSGLKRYYLGIPLDKIAHCGAYALLSFLLCAWWSLRKRRPGFWDSLLIMIILLSYGALEELTQKLVGRGCEFNDWLADVCGVTLGLIACQIVWFLKRRFYNPRFEKPTFIPASDLHW